MEYNIIIFFKHTLALAEKVEDVTHSLLILVVRMNRFVCDKSVDVYLENESAYSDDAGWFPHEAWRAFCQR